METKRYWRGEWWWMAKDRKSELATVDGGWIPMKRVEEVEVLMEILKEITNGNKKRKNSKPS